MRDPRFGVPYVELVYRPMLELFDLLRGHGFRVFVCSGGGRDFMRVFAEEPRGILKEDIIGSAAASPTPAAGSSAPTSSWAPWTWGRASPSTSSPTPSRCPPSREATPTSTSRCAAFALLVRHDDDQREYPYTKGAEASLARVEQLGRTVVSTKNDGTTVF
ncbi:hypothetical protein [Streptomyces sp. NPDC085540]|uniref:hypothetical protein n=1 Tax=Streptomyces sp. NPDC085540 TaxID=3365730 RepID=UPI0037CE42B9